MRAHIRHSRIGARLAIIGLTLGLAALASLALWGTSSTAETTGWLRSHDEVSDKWGQTLVAISVESEALSDYSMATDDIGRGPLLSAIGSAESLLTRLETMGTAEDRRQARVVHQGYRSYTENLRYIVELGEKGAPARALVLVDVTPSLEHRDDHVITDHHAFAGAPGQHEHPGSLHPWTDRLANERARPRRNATAPASEGVSRPGS